MQKRPELIPNTLSGDLRRGGWQGQMRVDGDTDAVVGDADNGHDNIRLDGRSLADFVDPGLRSYFNGHVIAKPDFRFQRHSSLATFHIGTVDNLLAGERVQDISFAAVGSPSNSHEATSWNFGQVVEHILQDHSNYIYDATGANGAPTGVVVSTDIDTTNSTGFEEFIVGDSDNMWRTLQQIGGGEGGGEFYRIWCTRKNVIKYQPEPVFLSPQPAAKGTLTKQHLRGPVRVSYHNTQPGEKVGQVQISAVKNATTVYDSTYPSNPGNGKIVQKTSGIWAQSQARADTLAERLYRWLSRSYTLRVQVDPGLALFGDDGLGLELGDRLLLTYDGPAEDTSTGHGVHLSLSSQSLFVYAVDIRFDSDRRRATATLTLEHDNSS